jgi:tetratricopeptide (TPR) repeat protein
MEFDDKPTFTVAGVTDPSSAGGHGSDVSLRTSERLARETLTLKPDGSEKTSSADAGTKGSLPPPSESQLRAAHEQARSTLGNANQSAQERAEIHRRLGDLDEKLSDPLEAVREYETAAGLNPSEQNYFEWGAELLLHKAIQPAVEVFTKGAHAHPESARMLAGLGVALYSAGSDEEAARRLCEASDLKPLDPAPYLFLGRMEKASSTSLSCSEPKLARFAREQPGNALANYYYAMTLWKRELTEGDPAGSTKIGELLKRAVEIDPNLGEAYLQLGVFYYTRGENQQAIRAYQKALEVSPDLPEAHYRLALAYQRIGEKSKAQEQLQLQEQTKKTEDAVIERQRHELQQFVVTLKDQPPRSPRK